MRAAILNHHAAEPPLAVGQWPDPVLPDGWVQVRVVRAALNRLDQMTVDDRGSLDAPAVIGSDAAGIVESVTPGVRDVSVGDEVIVLPSLWWGAQEDVQAEEFEILGQPTQGTHAELVAVPAENVFRKPARLSWEEAAALPLAGVTAWRAVVTRGRLRAGETMVVTAASSGVATFAIQLGASLGARVFVVTSSEEKLEAARRLGAEGGVLRTGTDLQAELVAVTGGIDLVVESTGAHWPELVRSMRPGGRLVALGRKAQDEGVLPVGALFWRQLDVLGTSMGSPRDFAALLAHLEEADWRPVVDSVFALEDVVAAYERLNAPERFGKVVLAC